MDLAGKKYEILPGTAVPNMKDILEAASDFSTPGVENLQIKGEHASGKSFSLDDVINDLHTMNEEDLKKLQALGDELSESEARSQEESRRKMEAIKNSAVIAPESLSQLRERAVNEVSEEKKAEIKKMQEEQEAKEAEEQAKAKAREERRQMQRQAILDSRAKAEEEGNKVTNDDTEASSTIISDEIKTTDDTIGNESAIAIEETSDKEVAASVADINPTPVVSPSNTGSTDSETSGSSDEDAILSSDDTLDDFSEFL